MLERNVASGSSKKTVWKLGRAARSTGGTEACQQRHTAANVHPICKTLRATGEVVTANDKTPRMANILTPTEPARLHVTFMHCVS